MRFASESKPQLAMPRNRRSPATPTSISRHAPAAITSAAPSSSLGIPRTRARSLPRPPGKIPIAASVPASAPPIWPISPSPLMTTGVSPPATASCAAEMPCSRSLVRTVRQARPRDLRAASAAGSSLLARPPPACGLTMSAMRADGTSTDRHAIGLRRRPTHQVPRAGPTGVQWLHPSPPEASVEYGVRRVEGRRRPSSRPRSRTRPGARTRHLGEERRHVELGDKVKRFLAERQVGGVGGSKRHAPSGSRPTLACARRTISSETSTPRTLGPRELPGEEEGRLSGAGADVENPLGRRLDVQHRRRQRSQVRDRARARALVPAGASSSK